MNKKDIEQIYFIEKELDMWQKELDSLREDGGLKSPLLDGMPKGKNWISDPVGIKATKNADDKELKTRKEHAEKQINNLMDKLVKKRLKIMDYIAEIEDSQMRMIIKLRCIDRLPWSLVARRIGGGNNAGNIRVKFFRHFEES